MTSSMRKPKGRSWLSAAAATTNRVTTTGSKRNRQPGSTIKPITVSVRRCKDHDYNEFSIVKDKPIKIGDWDTPKNEQVGGLWGISLQEMVNKSLNALHHPDAEGCGQTACRCNMPKKRGCELDENDKGSYAALGLGGMTKGTSTVEMAQSYPPLPM